jgi:hypothetical protein
LLGTGEKFVEGLLEAVPGSSRHVMHIDARIGQRVNEGLLCRCLVDDAGEEMKQAALGRRSWIGAASSARRRNRPT